MGGGTRRPSSAPQHGSVPVALLARHPSHPTDRHPHQIGGPEESVDNRHTTHCTSQSGMHRCTHCWLGTLTGSDFHIAVKNLLHGLSGGRLFPRLSPFNACHVVHMELELQADLSLLALALASLPKLPSSLAPCSLLSARDSPPHLFPSLPPSSLHLPPPIPLSGFLPPGSGGQHDLLHAYRSSRRLARLPAEPPLPLSAAGGGAAGAAGRTPHRPAASGREERGGAVCAAD